MKLYWRLESLPEFGFFPPPARAGILNLHPSWRLAWRLVGSVVCSVSTFGGVIWPVGMVVVGFDLPFVEGVVLACLVVALVLAAGFVLWYQIWMSTIRVRLRGIIWQMQRVGRLSICLACGYDLRGSRGDSCPECGASIRWDIAVGGGGRPGSTGPRGDER